MAEVCPRSNLQIIFGSMMPLLIEDAHQILTFHRAVIGSGSSSR